VPIDLRKINVPTYLYASREDHIVPWKTAYASSGIFTGKNRFVLGASGHIAGVINPPAKHKRSYWVGPEDRYPKHADQWLAKTTEHAGSWWPDWYEWLAGQSGKKIKAPSAPGNADFAVLESAPGSFVKVRAV
jgi:polyhydroxyalkanoate synthase